MDSNLNKIFIRVCFIGPKAYLLFNRDIQGVFGGAEVDQYYLATELAQDKDFEVSFIVADYGQSDTEEQENVRVIKSLDFNQNALIGAWKVRRALRQANADIYFMKTASPGVPLTSNFCKKNDKIFTYRVAHRYECDGTYLKKHFLLGKAFVRSLRQARIVFSQNVDDANKLKETIGVDSVIIPNGHRLPEIDISSKDEILWVGRTADFKKPSKYLKLARANSGERFVMICQEAFGRSGYEDLVREAQEIANLEFLPRVGFHQIDEYFQRAKVLVNTSDSEGFPNTFIQACKWATPILSLNVNPDGFLDQYQCGKCAKGDWETFVRMLTELAEPETQKEYGRNSRRYVEEHHDIKKIIAEYKRIFRELIVKKDE